MGVMAVPFSSIENAREFIKIMSEKLTKKDLQTKLYHIWFDDRLWDEIDSFADDEDVRIFMVLYLKQQLKELKYYKYIDKESVILLKDFLKKYNNDLDKHNR